MKILHYGKYMLLAILITLISIVTTEAQNNDNRDRLSDTQMANATTVESFENFSPPPIQVNTRSQAFLQSGSNEVERVYKLSNCDESNEQAACYLVITARAVIDQQASSLESDSGVVTQAAPLQVTQECGYSIYSWAGIEVARLQQRVNVTYTSGYTTLPAILNWGNFEGTYAIAPFYWDNLTGPTPNIGWGNKSFQDIYVTASGGYTSGIGNPTYYGTTLEIDDAGTICS